jgi:hypothetical protein
MLRNNTFYTLKPIIPRRLQILLRRWIALYKKKKYRDVWPIDPNAGNPPQGWKGWPESKRFALILTHDIDTPMGLDKCRQLMDLEASLGLRSSFNFVPEKYRVSSKLREEIFSRGFEVGVHGLLHDGKLYASKEIFMHRAKKINKYLEKWKAVGFRSPAMHHNLEWLLGLNIKYDSSTFDTDPFEPQSDGVETIFPFWVKKNDHQNGYVELPYTLAQDHLLFILMKETNLNIWIHKLNWIFKHNGMALLNTHPDYMYFNERSNLKERYSVKYYQQFLEYVIEYKNEFWNPLPYEIAEFWRSLKKL